MNKKFLTEEKVRFQHCDFAGIVFYPRYFEMINGLIEDWFEELGLPFDKMHEQNYGVPTKAMNITFKHAARLNEKLTKEMYVKELGNTSAVLHITFSHQGKQILEAESVLIFVQTDKESKRLNPIPWLFDIKSKMTEYLVVNA